MNTKLTPDFGTMLKKYSLSSETAKALGTGVVLVVLACLIVFGCPILIVHMWNNFFHAIFGLQKMYYWNAVAFLFFLCLAVGLIALLKDWGGDKGK